MARLEGPEHREARLFRFAILLVGVSWFASLLVAINVGHGYEFLLRVVPILPIGWWAAQRPLSWRRDIARLLGLMVVVTGIVIALGYMQYDEVQAKPGFWGMFGSTEREAQQTFSFLHLLTHDRLLATLGNANSAASFFVGSLILMMAIALMDRSWVRRIVGAVFTVILIWALLATDSRGGLVALA
jgi:hypothetical protein